MSSNIVDNSSFGTSNIKNLYTSIIRASKATSTDTFADLKLQAYNTSQTKNVTMTLSVQGDTPKLTLSSQGVATAGTIISGIANPQSSGDAANMTYMDNHTTATSTHGVTGNIVGTGGVQTLDNKTLTNAVITAASNSVTADALRFSNGIVTVNTGPSPAAKDILMATSGTEAKWDKVPYLPLEIMTNNVVVAADINVPTDADPFTRVRHYILSPVGAITYTLANATTSMLVDMEIYMTLISTGSLIVQADSAVHLYGPGYNGNPGGSYTLNTRGGTIQLKKRTNTEWVLMVF